MPMYYQTYYIRVSMDSDSRVAQVRRLLLKSQDHRQKCYISEIDPRN